MRSAKDVDKCMQLGAKPDDERGTKRKRKDSEEWKTGRNACPACPVREKIGTNVKREHKERKSGGLTRDSLKWPSMILKKERRGGADGGPLPPWALAHSLARSVNTQLC